LVLACVIAGSVTVTTAKESLGLTKASAHTKSTEHTLRKQLKQERAADRVEDRKFRAEIKRLRTELKKRQSYASLSVRGKAQLAATSAGVTGGEWAALATLIQRESGWNPNAVNPTSGACGLPQSLPCSKLPNGIYTSVRDQVLWMIRYCRGRYGSVSSALAHSYSVGWY